MQSDRTADSIRLILDDMKAFPSSKGVDATELQRVTEGNVRGLPNRFQTNSQVLNALLENQRLGRPDDYQRQLPTIKTIDYLMAVWLQPYLEERQAQDVIYHDGKLVTECPRSNLFIVTKDNQILTPAKNVLKGIIRKQLLNLEHRYPVAEADITLNDLFEATEIFITSTTKNILPVIQVDDRPVGNREPGPVTRSLALKLDELIQEVQHMVD